MSKYMKNLFPFHGIKKPLRAELEKPFIAEWKKCSYAKLNEILTTLWNLPEREFQYTALVLLRASKIWKHKESLELTEWLVLNKSWWDTVDAIAAQILGPYFTAHPENRNNKIKEWKHSDNLWLNRCTLIFQLKYREKTDVQLLFELIQYFAPQKEFFIKKAIGWALRELSYTQPELVTDFCKNNELQALSKKEALKALRRNGTV